MPSITRKVCQTLTAKLVLRPTPPGSPAQVIPEGSIAITNHPGLRPPAFWLGTITFFAKSSLLARVKIVHHRVGAASESVKTAAIAAAVLVNIDRPDRGSTYSSITGLNWKLPRIR
jgi:hypothetical protein